MIKTDNWDLHMTEFSWDIERPYPSSEQSRVTSGQFTLRKPPFQILQDIFTHVRDQEPITLRVRLDEVSPSSYYDSVVFEALVVLTYMHTGLEEDNANTCVSFIVEGEAVFTQHGS